MSGRTRSKGRLEVEADVRLDNYAVEVTDMRVRKSIAFVAQDDSLQVTATPREAIRFSAKLRLPSSTTDEDLDTLTKQMLYELGLEKCADTIMGGPLVKGVSGGERKRTSVGVELVTKPSMVFLDEPTSGLDSVRPSRRLGQSLAISNDYALTISCYLFKVFCRTVRRRSQESCKCRGQRFVHYPPTFFGDF